MRSSKKVPGTTIKARVLRLLEKGEILTATEAAHRVGSHWSTTSSLLKKLLDRGVVDRIPNYGPLLGYGYFLARHRNEIGRVQLVQTKRRKPSTKLIPAESLLICGDQEERTCACGRKFVVHGKSGEARCEVCRKFGHAGKFVGECHAGGDHEWTTDCGYGDPFCRKCGAGKRV